MGRENFNIFQSLNNLYKFTLLKFLVGNEIFSAAPVPQPQYNLVCLEFQRIQEKIYWTGRKTERRSSDGQDQRYRELAVRGRTHSEDFQPGIQGERRVLVLPDKDRNAASTIDQMQHSLLRDWYPVEKYLFYSGEMELYWFHQIICGAIFYFSPLSINILDQLVTENRQSWDL